MPKVETKEQRKEYNKKAYEKQKAMKLVSKDFTKKDDEIKNLLERIRLLEENNSNLKVTVVLLNEKISNLEDELRQKPTKNDKPKKTEEIVKSNEPLPFVYQTGVTPEDKKKLQAKNIGKGIVTEVLSDDENEEGSEMSDDSVSEQETEEQREERERIERGEETEEEREARERAERLKAKAAEKNRKIQEEKDRKEKEDEERAKKRMNDRDMQQAREKLENQPKKKNSKK